MRWHNGDVSAYYRRSHWLYSWFWYSSTSLAMHYGYWEGETKNHDEALLNQYKYVVEKGKIRAGMRVLDAGCGVGGGAIFIAKHTQAQCVGIGIVADQVERARYLAGKHKVRQLCRFKVADFTHTGFEDDSFDVVYAIESACHAYPKARFLREMMRVLKPGGIMVINDGYCRRKPIDKREAIIVENFCEGWKLAELIEISKMRKEVEAVGFGRVVVEDMTAKVGKSLRRMSFLVRLARPFTWIKSVAENVQSMTASILGVERGLFGYYSITARKPVK